MSRYSSLWSCYLNRKTSVEMTRNTLKQEIAYVQLVCVPHIIEENGTMPLNYK